MTRLAQSRSVALDPCKLFLIYCIAKQPNPNDTMKIPAFFLAAALAPAAIFAFVPKSAPDTRVAFPLEVLEGNNMVVVNAKANGAPCTLLLDTGATHTTFDKTFVATNFPDAKPMSVGIAGDTNVAEAPKCIQIGSLQIGDANFGDFSVMTIDLSHMKTGRRIDGILGMNVLLRKPLLLSLARNQAVVNPSKDDLTGFAAPVPSLSRDVLELVVVAEHGGKKVPVLLDSASTWTILPDGLLDGEETAAGAFGITDINQRTSAQESDWKRHAPATIKIGGDISVTPMVTGSVAPRIGADTLRRYDALLSVRRLALRPAGDGDSL